VLGSLSLASEIPEIQWKHGDDLCDCTFQRIGWWTNPYIARTLEIRLCCVWAKMAEEYPDFFRESPAFTDYSNGDVPVTELLEWNAEDADMPRALWYRQLASLHGRPLSEIRDRFQHMEPPKAVKGSGVRLHGDLANGSH
jgi:hypothetical protein